MENRRKHKRVRINNLSKLNDANCSVINISKDGILLTTDVKPSQKSVDIQLKISGHWVDLSAEVMWLIKEDEADSVSMGVCITHAPKEYIEFVNNLYLEANGR